MLGQAAESAAGRWEGSAQVPGGELKLILDLSDESGQGWIGSIIIPGFGVKGAPLVDLKGKGSDLAFAIKGALGNERTRAGRNRDARDKLRPSRRRVQTMRKHRAFRLEENRAAAGGTAAAKHGGGQGV